MDATSLKHWIPPDARFRMGRKLLHLPVISGTYIWLRPAFRGYRFSPEAALVVDGFPRSANTYAWHALKVALDENTILRGHTHSPFTLIRAARTGVPALLVVRHPDDAVASYVQQATGVKVASAFQAYIDFHAPLMPILSRIVVADFTDVVSDFGAVMRRVNDRFGTQFPLYEATALNEEIVRRQIDDANRARWNGVLREAGVARPSPHRKSARKVLVDLDVVAQRSRRRAVAIYAEVLGSCIAG